MTDGRCLPGDTVKLPAAAAARGRRPPAGLPPAPAQRSERPIGFNTFPRGREKLAAAGPGSDARSKFHVVDGLINSVLHPGDSVIQVQKLIQTPVL